MPGLKKSRSQEEREAPEGQDSPPLISCSLKESHAIVFNTPISVVRRPLADRMNKRARRLSTRRFRVNWNALDQFNQEINAEVRF